MRSNVLASLHALFLNAVPHLSPTLVEESNIDKITLLTQQFSDVSLTSLIGFEFPLARGQRWMDFLFHLDITKSNLPDIISVFDRFADSCTEETQTFWKQLVGFLQNWNLERHTWFTLELDVGSSKTWPPRPNLFLCTKDFQGDAWPKLIEAMSLQLTQKPADSKMIEYMKKYCELCASSDIEIFGCGFMLARTFQGMRVDVMSPSFLRSDFLLEHLALAGYKHDLRHLDSILKKLKPFINKCAAAVDVGQAMGERIGIECSALQSEWPSIFSVLLSENLVTEEKCRECLQWRGHNSSISMDEEEGSYVRWISHIKFICKPASPIAVKVYFAFRYQPGNLSALSPT